MTFKKNDLEWDFEKFLVKDSLKCVNQQLLPSFSSYKLPFLKDKGVQLWDGATCNLRKATCHARTSSWYPETQLKVGGAGMELLCLPGSRCRRQGNLFSEIKTLRTIYLKKKPLKIKQPNKHNSFFFFFFFFLYFIVF